MPLRLTLAVLLLTSSLTAAAADDWPRFYGPNRDNRSAETGLLTEWPEGGPKLLWQVNGLGHGYSGVAVADGIVYATGDTDENLVITAFDLSGSILWTQDNGAPFTRAFPGSRATPTIVDGELYNISGNGDVVRMDAGTGQVAWTVNMMERFGGREVQWGIAESPLVYDSYVICSPGGEDVYMAALDRDTGETRWTCTGVGDEHSYVAPALVEYQGLRQIVTMTNAGAIGIHAGTGKLLWRFDREAPYGVNCDTPLFDDGHIYIFTTWNRGASKLRLDVDGDMCSVEEVWHRPEFDNEHGGVMLVDGYLYGHADGNHKRRHFACCDAETGEVAWTSDDLAGQASSALTYAEGLLYIASDKGEIALVRPNPERLEIISQFQLPKGGIGPVWAYPVISDRRLYLRHGETLFVYDISAGDA